MKVTDAHAHVIVPEILREADPSERWRPRVWHEDGAQLVELDGRTIRAAVGEFVDADRIVDAQAGRGVEHTMLCPWVPLLFHEVEPEAGRRRCRIQNDALARLVAPRRDRLSALGAVPLQDPALAARELEALMAAGGLGGVEVTASIAGTYLGDARFEPFWSAAEATGALVFVHPTTLGFDSSAFSDYYLWNTAGNPLETTITGAHMIMAGVMERHPDLRVLLAHGGGALLSLRGRLRHAHGFQPQARESLDESPEDSIRRFHFDTVTHDRDLLRALIAYVGAERVLLGSDHPFDMADPDPVGTVRSLGLDPGAEEAVLGGNATRLLAASGGAAEEWAA